MSELCKLQLKLMAEAREKAMNTYIRAVKRDIITSAIVGQTSSTLTMDSYRNDEDFCNDVLASIKDDLPSIEVSESFADGVRTYRFSWKE